MEDDEGWVLSASRSRSAKISTITTHGTHNTVAAPVENFPFLPPDNRRHEPNRSETTTTGSPFQRTSCSIVSIDATNNTHTSCDIDEGFSPIVCKCPLPFCRGSCPTAASLWRQQSAFSLRPTTSRSIDDAPPKHPTSEPPQRQPIDLKAIQAEIRASMERLDWLFPADDKDDDAPIPRQPDSSLHSPIPFSMTPIEPPEHEPVDLAAIQDQIRASLATLDRLFPLPMSTTTTLPLQHPEPPLPITTPPAPIETEATVTTFPPLRTRIERLLSNSPISNAVLWMPDIVYRRVPNRSPELDLPCSSNPPRAPCTLHPGHPLDNNLQRTQYDHNYNPAFDIHLLTVHRQQCHQHHSLLTNHDPRPYNPAFDIHPTRPVHRQQPKQNHTRFSVATYVPGLAQNKRPP